MNTSTSLSLILAIEPKLLQGTRMSDTTLHLRFTNSSTIPVRIFPDAAMMNCVAGWSSPQWHLHVKTPENTHQRELRSWYGPPSEPPDEYYYSRKLLTIPVGGHVATTLKACWVPKHLLKPENLAKNTLDPENRDNINFATDNTSLILLNEDCASVRKRQIASPLDFLRPGIVLFIPSTGLLEFSIGYSQKKWVSFSPLSEFSVMSNTVKVKIEN